MSGALTTHEYRRGGSRLSLPKGPQEPVECTVDAKEPSPVLPVGALLRLYVRRRPTLPHRHQCSTIGAEGLSFRVRNGTGRFPFAMTAVTLGRYFVFPGVTTNSLQRYYVVFVFPTVSRELHSGRVAMLLKAFVIKLSAY
jgi:hypothetical protein